MLKKLTALLCAIILMSTTPAMVLAEETAQLITSDTIIDEVTESQLDTEAAPVEDKPVSAAAATFEVMSETYRLQYGAKGITPYFPTGNGTVVQDGQQLVLPAFDSRWHYPWADFTGWSYANVSYNPGDTITLLYANADHTYSIRVTPIWQPRIYTVNYDANGGSINTSTEQQNGAIVFSNWGINPTSEIPVRLGYTFAGWKAPDEKIYFHTDEQLPEVGVCYKIGEDEMAVTLVAQWEPATYTATFMPTSATTGTAPAAITTNGPDYSMQLPGSTALVRDYYTLTGWRDTYKKFNSTEAQPWEEVAGVTRTYGAGETYTYADDKRAVRFEPVWTANTYKITFDGNGNTGGTLPGQAVGETRYSYTISGYEVTKPGYVHVGWTDGNKVYSFWERIYFSTAGNSSIALKAVWEEVKYTTTLRVNNPTGNYETVKTFTTSASSPSIQLPAYTWAVPNGLTFSCWYYNGRAYQPGEIITPTSNGEIAAVYSQISYIFVFSKGDATGGTPPANIVVVPGTAITMPGAGSLVKTGYTFKGWKTPWGVKAPGEVVPTQANSIGTVTCTPAWEQTDNGNGGGTDPAPKTGVEGFVSRLYQTAIQRPADQEGLNYWVNALNNGSATGTSVVNFFFNSQEFIGQNHDYSTFINLIYTTVMGRQPDQDGLDFWLSELQGHKNEQKIINGFLNSEEFKQLCAEYGINPGTTNTVTTNTAGLSRYIQRVYLQVMGRDADTAGLQYWLGEMLSGRKAPKSIVEAFIAAPEFANKGTDNTEYLKVMYRAFMGREAEQPGLDYWLGQMAAGMNRQGVLDSFAGSQEFQNIVAGFGL